MRRHTLPCAAGVHVPPCMHTCTHTCMHANLRFFCIALAALLRQLAIHVNVVEVVLQLRVHAGAAAAAVWLG